MNAERSDAALVRDVASGDRDALATLFQRHHHNVYGLSLRLSGNEDEAEDVTQEVFLRVLRHASSFASQARVSTWLFSITRTVFLTQQRSAARERSKRDGFATESNPAETDRGEDVSERLGRLRAALDRLDPEKREVLMMKRFHGLSHDEIARICGCSTGAVRVRLHRALQTLREGYFELQGLEAQAPTEG